MPSPLFTDLLRRDPPKEPGQWSRSRAHRLRYDLAHRCWPLLFVIFGAFAAVGLGVLFLPVPNRQFFAGVLVASGSWAVVFFVEQFSGAAAASMGETAEHWTASELRPLRRSGWHVIHGARLGRRGDIDHVALGPGGVLVIETKWRSGGWDGRSSASALAQAVEQVRHNAREVRLTLPRLGPVSAVVVLWGHPQPETSVVHDEDVTVVAGNSFDRWLAEYAKGAATAGPEEIKAGWTKLRAQTRRRDAYDERSQAPQPTLERTLWELAVGGVAGLVAAFLLLELIGPWYPVFNVALAAGLWFGRVRTRFRRVLTAAAVAVAGLTLELLLVTAALVVDHIVG